MVKFNVNEGDGFLDKRLAGGRASDDLQVTATIVSFDHSG